MHPNNLAARAGRWSAQHRGKAIAGWVAFVVLALLAGGLTGTRTLDSEDLGNGESRRADQALAQAFPESSADETVLVQSERLTARDGSFRAAVRDVEQRVDAVPVVGAVRSPLERSNAGQISPDGRSALVQLEIRGDPDDAADKIEPVLAAVKGAQAAHPELRIAQFGEGSADKALSESFEDDFRRAEMFSLPITLLILVVAFGALVAAGIPLLLALSAVGGTLGLMSLVSQISPVDEAISSVILLIGLAVGVDYTMFYLRREREERAAGRDADAALAAAAATSGHAVLVSGLTVMVAMAGMYLTGSATFTSFATGTILVVGVAMIGSVTVLPALLSKLGDRVEKGRIPFLGRRPRDGDSRVWAAILDRVLRRPALSLVLAGGLLVALTIPAFGLHTANPGVQGLPRDLEVMQAYDRIQEAFPGGEVPAEVVVRADDVTAPAVQAAIGELRTQALATGVMHEPIQTGVSADQTLVRVDIPLAGEGTDETSEAALTRLRDDLIPATVGAVDGVRADVTGMTAGSRDFNDQMQARIPLVFGFVLGMAFLILLVTFRSIVIPLKAIALNLLSVGAAYGVLVLVFQHGWGESLLGFESIGGITSWLPLFLFVILFGLSMDYHVFILSRIREAYDRGMSTEDAVAHGIRSTAGVVTSAAVVMVAVFSIFATLSSLEFKQMGVGLATAVLIDATLVRGVLLPAAMKLLGDYNWYLPRFLRRVPRLAPEGAAG